MNWLIITETYREMSNGVKLMHEMCHHLNNMGEKAYMAFTTPDPDPSKRSIMVLDAPGSTNPKLNTPVLNRSVFNNNFIQQTIVIYPDALLGNPLNAKNIVRFLGNRPGNCTPGFKAEIEKNAFVLSHSKIFADYANANLFNSRIDSMFYIDNEIPFKNRTLDIIYHGKGTLTSKCDIFENTFYIDRYWPKDRKQLAYLLKQCRYFYTYDSMTNTNSEAIAAGAVPIFLRWHPWTEQEIDNMELGIIPRGQFLEIKDNKIYATVDIEKFNEQRNIFLNNVKYYEETWDNRFKETVQQIKQYFS